MPEKHRKSGTSPWKAPLRYYKDNTFSGGKQIVLKTGHACFCGLPVKFHIRIFLFFIQPSSDATYLFMPLKKTAEDSFYYSLLIYLKMKF